MRNQARRYGGLRTHHRHFQVWCKLKETDLDAAYPTLVCLHVAHEGRPARCPLCMFRSCLAMVLCGVSSFDVWVSTMCDDPFYDLISGLLPEDIPGVGTLSDYQDRLLQRPRRPRTTARRPSNAVTSRTEPTTTRTRVTYGLTKVLSTGWQSASWPALLEAYGHFSALPTRQRILQPLFFACFVVRSVDLRLIDLQNLHVAGEAASSPPGRIPAVRSSATVTTEAKGHKSAVHATAPIVTP